MSMSPEQALHRLGFPSFRGMQESVVRSIVEGNDTFVLMATSGGKSLCYMVPALCLPRYTIVISPLVALMQDQKTQMSSRGIKAESLTGETPWEERERLIAAAGRGEIQVLLFSPELLSSLRCQELISENPPSLVAFDEAHCISTWGQDFRPEYCEVGAYLDTVEEKSGHHIIRAALTATASPLTVDDIIHFAGLRSPNILTSPLVRDNLNIFVNPRLSQEDIDRDIIADLKYFGDACGIIYCQRRVECERLASVIRQHGLRCVTHHGAMTIDDRNDSAEQYLSGAVNIIIATIGFGMGINKPDVRYVIHNGISSSPEAWYQEIGRGGRDGKDAVAITYVMPFSSPKIRFGSLRRGNSWEVSLNYAEALYGDECRMKKVMRCFGEETEDCGKCDVCRGIKNPVRVVDVSSLLSVIKRLSKKPESYLPHIVAREENFPIELIGFVQDMLFMNEYSDYEFIHIPDCPPLPFVVPTGKTFDEVQVRLNVPDPVSHYYSSTVDGWLDLISHRVKYDGHTLPETAIQFILERRPTVDDLQNRNDIRLPQHLYAKLGTSHQTEVIRTRLRPRGRMVEMQLLD